MSRTAFAAAILAGCGAGTADTAPPPIVVPTQPVVPAAAPVPVELPPATPASVVQADEPPPETPPPPADYVSLGDVVLAGKGALKKMVRLRVFRDHYTSATQFTAVPCVESVPLTSIWLRYRPEQRDYVRAMHDTPRDACATVSFRVVAFRGGPAPLVEGSIEHVGTIVPKKAAKPEAGADYASIDDAILAGAEAKGKIIAGDFWAYNGNPKELWVHDCKQRDSFLFVVPKTTAQQNLGGLLSHSPGKCERAHLMMADPDYVASGGGESLARPRADVVSIP